MMTIRETQLIELEIMKQLHDYCKKWNLRYCMIYGTLLGAVRHQGFIPWDNDMDIGMPRPDYERLLELVKTHPIGDNLYCVHYSNDPKYHYQVIRVCDSRTKVKPRYIREQPSRMGVWVDIFPFDGVESSSKHILRRIALTFYQWMQRCDIYNPSSDPNRIHGAVKCILHKLLPDKDNLHMRKIDYYASTCSYDSARQVADVIERKYVPLSREDFDLPIELPFEKYTFFAPKDWNGYLTRAYGNYMQMPPADKRVTHDIMAEWS